MAPRTPETKNIPDEIIVIILSKLPIQSLLLFMSVCKRWRSIISDPQFHKTNSLFLTTLHRNHPMFYTVDDESSIKSIDDPWKKVTGTSNFKRSLFMTNSCDGLVLIGIDESLFLFNPFTRYFRKVLTLSRVGSGEYVTSGFCYDASVNDYKFIIAHDPWFRMSAEFVLVASLREKNWERVSIEPFSVGTLRGGPVVNGRMHWTACKNVDNSSSGKANREIIWFDAGKNVFNVLPSPNLNNVDEYAIVGLGILDGCLSMARADSNGSVEVLTMKEYGVVESWTTMFALSNANVDRFNGDFTPLLVKKNGDVIVRINNRVISVYSVSKDLVNNVGFPFTSEPVNVAPFEETIVSPLTTIGVQSNNKGLGVI